MISGIITETEITKKEIGMGWELRLSFDIWDWGTCRIFTCERLVNILKHRYVKVIDWNSKFGSVSTLEWWLSYSPVADYCEDVYWDRKKKKGSLKHNSLRKAGGRGARLKTGGMRGRKII